MALTERQIKSLQTKIQRIKKALADDKKRGGGQYDDGRGLRYLPPELYLKMQDYSGSLRYFNWFHKNFPDDSGFPDFLFEWTITLFYCGKIKEAEKKAVTTYFSNRYYFDKYFGKPVLKIERKYSSNWEKPDMTRHFAYSAAQEQFSEFAKWLEQFTGSEKFTSAVAQYHELEKQLDKEHSVLRRSAIIEKMHRIKYSAD